MADKTEPRPELDEPFLGHRDEHPPKPALEGPPASMATEPPLVDENAPPVSRADTPDAPFMGTREEHPPKPIEGA